MPGAASGVRQKSFAIGRFQWFGDRQKKRFGGNFVGGMRKAWQIRAFAPLVLLAKAPPCSTLAGRFPIVRYRFFGLPAGRAAGSLL